MIRMTVLGRIARLSVIYQTHARKTLVRVTLVRVDTLHIFIYYLLINIICIYSIINICLTTKCARIVPQDGFPRAMTVIHTSYREKYPLNMYLLAFWTFVEAYTIGVVCATYATVGQASE